MKQNGRNEASHFVEMDPAIRTAADSDLSSALETGAALRLAHYKHNITQLGFISCQKQIIINMFYAVLAPQYCCRIASPDVAMDLESDRELAAYVPYPPLFGFPIFGK